MADIKVIERILARLGFDAAEITSVEGARRRLVVRDAIEQALDANVPEAQIIQLYMDRFNDKLKEGFSSADASSEGTLAVIGGAEGFAMAADVAAQAEQGPTLGEAGIPGATGPTITKNEILPGVWAITDEFGQTTIIRQTAEPTEEEALKASLENQLLQQRLDKGAVGGTGAAPRTEFESERLLREAQAGGVVSADEQVRQFAASLGLSQDQMAQMADQFDVTEGRLSDQFLQSIGLSRDQLAASMEQFGITEARLRDQLALTAEVERGRLDVDRGRLGVEQGRLGLDTELGRGRLGLDTTLGLGELGLEQSKFVANILRNPSDALARLFMQRGEESPVPFVSQADLINRLRTEFTAAQEAGQVAAAGGSRLDGTAGAGGLAGPTAAPTTTFTGPLADEANFTLSQASPEFQAALAAGTADVEGSIFDPAFREQVAAEEQARFDASVAETVADIEGGAGFGGTEGSAFTEAVQAELERRVALEPAPAPAPTTTVVPEPDFEETIFDTLESKQQQLFLEPRELTEPELEGFDPSTLDEATIRSLSDTQRTLLGFRHGGSTQSRLLRVGEGGDEIIANPTGAPLVVLNHKQTNRLTKKSKNGIKGFQTGTLSGDISRLISGGEVSQPELTGLAEQGTAPGPRDVLAGRTPSPFRIPGLPTPTAMNFSRLSGAERENLRPVLASKFNSTLEDLMFGIEQRFSPNPRLRSRARLVSR